jgi:hypothetical protein
MSNWVDVRHDGWVALPPVKNEDELDRYLDLLPPAPPARIARMRETLAAGRGSWTSAPLLPKEAFMPHTLQARRAKAELLAQSGPEQGLGWWPGHMAPPIGGNFTSPALALIKADPNNKLVCYNIGYSLVKYLSEDKQFFICDCGKCPPMPRGE